MYIVTSCLWLQRPLLDYLVFDEATNNPASYMYIQCSDERGIFKACLSLLHTYILCQDALVNGTLSNFLFKSIFKNLSVYSIVFSTVCAVITFFEQCDIHS